MGSSTGNPFGWLVPPTVELRPTARAIVDALQRDQTKASPATSPLFAPFGSAPVSPYSPGYNFLLGSAEPPAELSSSRLPLPAAPFFAPARPKPGAPDTKRRVFFSFQFEGDAMRANNVRNNWKISHPDSALARGFFDSSLWEERKLTSPEAIKKLIAAGVLYTSAVCVLAGSMTWDRRWVRYEIARAIIDLAKAGERRSPLKRNDGRCCNLLSSLDKLLPP